MKNIISKLITDKFFNIYTRNGFEYIMKKSSMNKKIYLLDFNDIKKLNSNIGYKKVNEKFRYTFSILKNKYIIGRAFSGDEIFLSTSDLNDNISYIKDVCEKNDLYFKYIEYTLSDTDILEDVLDNMTDNFHYYE